MTMRAFTQLEEQALLRMLGQPGASWRPIPPAPGKCPYNRLAGLGCAQVMSQGGIRSARLTVAGRYFAGLLAMRAVNKVEMSGDGRPLCITIEPFPLPALVDQSASHGPGKAMAAMP